MAYARQCSSQLGGQSSRFSLERSGGKDKILNFLANCEAVYDLRVPNWQESEPLNLADLSTRYEELVSEGVGHTDLLCVA